MNGLVKDLLALARSEAGELTAQTSDFRVAPILESAIRQARPSSAQVILEVHDPEFGVRGVESDLTRLVTNLIDNATVHSGGDEIRVILDHDGIAVADNGRGIAPEHLPRIFDRFYRTDESRATDTGGTGLGLAIVSSISALHGGKVEVKSEVGHGTTFFVRLPRRSLPEANKLVTHSALVGI